LRTLIGMDEEIPANVLAWATEFATRLAREDGVSEVGAWGVPTFAIDLSRESTRLDEAVHQAPAEVRAGAGRALRGVSQDGHGGVAHHARGCRDSLMIWKLLIAGGVGSLVSVGLMFAIIIWWASKIRF
jgi:hypothetical protein